MDIYTSYDTTTQQMQISSGSTTKKTSGTVTTANSGEDTADWSSAALSMSDSSSSGLISPTLQLNAKNEILQQHLTSALATKFAKAGIDVSQPITLTRDSDGNVTVVGDNDDKDAIEQIFADSSTLTEAFNTLADNCTLAKSYTSNQTASLVRANGYSAYLQQLTDSSSSDSSSNFFLSMLGKDSATYFS